MTSTSTSTAPEASTATPTAVVTLPSTDLARMIRVVEPHVDRSEIPCVLSSILLEVNVEYVTAIATDRHTLAAVRRPAARVPRDGPGWRALLDEDDTRELLTYLAGGWSRPVRLEYGFDQNHETWVVALTGGTDQAVYDAGDPAGFPDWRRRLAEQAAPVLTAADRADVDMAGLDPRYVARFTNLHAELGTDPVVTPPQRPDGAPATVTCGRWFWGLIAPRRHVPPPPDTSDPWDPWGERHGGHSEAR